MTVCYIVVQNVHTIDARDKMKGENMQRYELDKYKDRITHILEEADCLLLQEEMQTLKEYVTGMLEKCTGKFSSYLYKE